MQPGSPTYPAQSLCFHKPKPLAAGMAASLHLSLGLDQKCVAQKQVDVKSFRDLGPMESKKEFFLGGALGIEPKCFITELHPQCF